MSSLKKTHHNISGMPDFPTPARWFSTRYPIQSTLLYLGPALVTYTSPQVFCILQVQAFVCNTRFKRSNYILRIRRNYVCKRVNKSLQSNPLPSSSSCLYPRDIVYLWTPRSIPRHRQLVLLLSEFHIYCYFMYRVLHVLSFKGIFSQYFAIVRLFLVNGQPSLKNANITKSPAWSSPLRARHGLQMVCYRQN